MKLKINNKIFDGIYNENNILIIPLEDVGDVIFFKTWQNRARTAADRKQDYVDNITFEKITERGLLINCFPILSINEDFVELHYDYIIKL